MIALLHNSLPEESKTHLKRFCESIDPENKDQFFQHICEEIYQTQMYKQLLKYENLGNDDGYVVMDSSSLLLKRFESDFSVIRELFNNESTRTKVYQVKNLIDGNYYAIKCIIYPINVYTDELINESIYFSNFNHPNIVRYYNSWIDLPKEISINSICYCNLYIQMELCINNLAMFNTSYSTSNESQLSVKQKLILLSDVSHGLEYLHSEKVVHRGITPKNILVGLKGGSDDHYVAKICDFETVYYVGKSNRDVRLESFDSMYCAPECVESPVFETDVYSFCLTVIQFLLDMTEDETSTFIFSIKYLYYVISDKSLYNSKECTEMFKSKFNNEVNSLTNFNKHLNEELYVVIEMLLKHHEIVSANYVFVNVLKSVIKRLHEKLSIIITGDENIDLVIKSIVNCLSYKPDKRLKLSEVIKLLSVF